MCHKPVAAVLIMLFLAVFAFDKNGMPAAQNRDQGNPQSADDIKAVPDRPTFCNSADIVQRDVFELEYGSELAHSK